MHIALRKSIHWLRAALLVALATLAPPAAHAQSGGVRVEVQVRDLAGAGLKDATVTLLDDADALLDSAATDALGTVVFPQVVADTVRVQVTGTLPSGAALVLPTSDAQGIALLLSDRLPALLLLRVEPNGTVRPDVDMWSDDASTAAPRSVVTALPAAPSLRPTAPVEHSSTADTPVIATVIYRAAKAGGLSLALSTPMTQERQR
jgi:hypothetical protein